MPRDVILLRKDVAPNYYRKPWPEVVAAAEAAADGVRLTQQNGSGGSWDFHSIAPAGWAAFYRGTGRQADVCCLHVQNWTI